MRRRLWLVLLSATVMWSQAARAQPETTTSSEPVSEAQRRARASARVAAADAALSPPPKDAFAQHTRMQSALEAQVGLRLYQTGDDYRAITAMRRFQILAANAEANYLANLIIGQIYHRNDKHQLAVINWEQAVLAAPSTDARVWTYLLTNQELCLPLAYYFHCRQRLDELSGFEDMSSLQRELIDYKRLYVDVVLRSPYATNARVNMFTRPDLRTHAQGLIAQNKAFEELDLQRPWLAATLSGLLPGAGQLYNGRPIDAGVALGMNALFAGATYYAFAEADSIPLGVVSGIVFAGFYVGNIINAYTDANRQNARTYLAFFEQLKVDHWPRVAFDIRDNRVAFGYSFDWPGEKKPPAAASPTPVAPSKPDEEAAF